MESSSLGEKRETLASRLGFLMLSVGCAVGLGNVWRFPFIVGKFGGGMFVLLYLFFLVLLGWPVLLMELSVGRASRRNLVGAFGRLALRMKAGSGRYGRSRSGLRSVGWRKKTS